MGLVSDERYALDLYPGASRCNALCGWSDANRKDLQSRRTGGAVRSFVCWQGVEFYFNVKNGTWDDWTPEAGHFGPSVYPGCGKVRYVCWLLKTLTSLTF